MTVPSLGPAGGWTRNNTTTPGIVTPSSVPTLTGFASNCLLQNSRCAATSLTLSNTCPIVMTASPAGKSCASSTRTHNILTTIAPVTAARAWTFVTCLTPASSNTAEYTAGLSIEAMGDVAATVG